MKQKLLKVACVLFVVCFFTVSLFGCIEYTDGDNTDTATETKAKDSSDGMRLFDAEIIEVHPASVTVIPIPQSGADFEAVNAGKTGLVVSTKLVDGCTVQGLCVGDVVNISYDGMIAETYPAQILKVYSIDVYKKTTSDTETYTDTNIHIDPGMADLKPVIYLYPEQECEVSVKLTLGGELTECG